MKEENCKLTPQIFPHIKYIFIVSLAFQEQENYISLYRHVDHIQKTGIQLPVNYNQLYILNFHFCLKFYKVPWSSLQLHIGEKNDFCGMYFHRYLIENFLMEVYKTLDRNGNSWFLERVMLKKTLLMRSLFETSILQKSHFRSSMHFTRG